MSNDTTPTLTTYTEWQTAYDFFNKELFGGQLPECLITLQNKRRQTLGCFTSKHYVNERGELKDGLSMNPFYFHSRSLIETLSTLVHEMCHVWEYHFGEGKKSSRRYHSKKWGEQMKKVGLMPSDTGAPGGAETGQRMTHYIIDGGLFEKKFKRLLSNKFKISWGELSWGEYGIGTAGSVNASPRSKNQYKVKYLCGSCGAMVWGKSDLQIVCGKCTTAFIPEQAV